MKNLYTVLMTEDRHSVPDKTPAICVDSFEKPFLMSNKKAAVDLRGAMAYLHPLAEYQVFKLVPINSTRG